jgi:hypothetical protein
MLPAVVDVCGALSLTENRPMFLEHVRLFGRKKEKNYN